VISGFCREVDENCILLGYYAVSSGNSLPKLQDNVLVPSSRGKNVTRKWGVLLWGLYREESTHPSNDVLCVPHLEVCNLHPCLETACASIQVPLHCYQCTLVHW